MKICTIGCGPHAHSVHGPAQRKYAATHSATTLAGCCDLDKTRAQSYAQQFGFQHSYSNWEEMIAHEKPDAVGIVLPPQYLAKVAVPLLEEGVPLLLEKPPGLTEQMLDVLIEAARLGGGKNLVAFNRRYTPLLEKGLRILEANVSPKDVLQIDYDMVRYDRRDPDFSITAIHAIDAALFLARSPYVSARFDFRELPQIGPTIAAVSMNAVCESGTRVRCNFQPVAGAVLERMTIHAISHTLTISLPMWNSFDSPGLLRHWKNDQLIYTVKGDELGSGTEMFELCGFYDETVAFYEAVRHGLPMSPSLEETRHQIVLMEKYRARYQRTITLGEKSSRLATVG